MSLSVIVPAYDETLNIRPLTERLFAATRAAKLDVELLIADDESKGSDATAEVASGLWLLRATLCGCMRGSGRKAAGCRVRCCCWVPRVASVHVPVMWWETGDFFFIANSNTYKSHESMHGTESNRRFQRLNLSL